MKLKCGPTLEEQEAKRKARTARREAEWAKLTSSDTVFALWPRRIRPGDCRWLELVRRVPQFIQFEGRWSDWTPIGATDTEHHDDLKRRYVHGGRRIKNISYRYEVIEGDKQ